MKPTSKAKAVEESKGAKASTPPLPRLRKGDKDNRRMQDHRWKGEYP